MQLLLDFPTIGEPHYAQAIPASLITDKQIKTFDLADNKDPYAALSESDTGVDAQRPHGARLDDEHPQPLHARQHRGRAGG